MFRKAGKMVVDRWLGLLSRTLLLRKGQKKHAIHTAVVMQSRRSLVTSAHSDCERRSCELAQQASMEANSAAQGALRASFLGRTLSCSNFMMVDESEHVTTLKATKKRCRGKCHVVDASPRVHRPTWQRRSFPLTVTCCDDIMVRGPPMHRPHTSVGEKAGNTYASDSGSTCCAGQPQLERYAVCMPSFMTYAFSRKAAVQAANKPHSTREAGAGGSTNTMMRINTEDSKGLSVYVRSCVELTLQRPRHCTCAVRGIRAQCCLTAYSRKGGTLLY